MRYAPARQSIKLALPFVVDYAPRSKFAARPGPTSSHNIEGLDRPFDVQFGPDGSLYIVDYGVVKAGKSLKKSRTSHLDKEMPGTGSIWKVMPQET